MNADSGRPTNQELTISEAEKHKTLKKVVFSSFLGNFIEWFDYASYSYLATVLALVFFPGEDKMVATMMTFGVFALAFLVRPLGAIFWGNMGDKKGRKWALSTSILLMSGATFLIGCLPGYAMLGIGAPLLLLLLRMVQSFSASGEYAGAATFIAEYSPKELRGFYCSMVPASTAVGLLIGSLFATWMFNTFGATSEFVVDWGWRIPFWLAGPLGFITHYIREHLEKQVIVECCARATSAGIEQLDRAIVLQEKAMAEEDRIGFFLSDNLMHHMIFSIACRSTVWSWLEETNADLERFRWLRAATQVLDNQDIVNEHKQIRRAIAGRDPIEASFLVSKHLHMMFRNQTEVLDQFPEYFETSKLR